MHQHTGSRRLWREMRLLKDLCADKEVVIELKEWNTDWKKYAKYITSLEPEDVLVCAYSWGGGYGMPQFTKRLKMPVTCVMCDPVYHSPTPLGRWNVSVVRWLMQEGDKLDGDPLKGGASICKPEILEYNHTEIDDSPEYHKAAIQIAKTFIGK